MAILLIVLGLLLMFVTVFAGHFIIGLVLLVVGLCACAGLGGPYGYRRW